MFDKFLNLCKMYQNDHFFFVKGFQNDHFYEKERIVYIMLNKFTTHHQSLC